MHMRVEGVTELEVLKVTPGASAWVTDQLKLPIPAERNREGRTTMQKSQDFYVTGVSQICSDN